MATCYRECLPLHAPEDMPELVVAQATDYYVQAPKLFYLYNPPCAPIVEGEGSDSGPQAISPATSREGTTDRSRGEGLESPVEQSVGRTAVYGAAPREMYDYVFDSFCSPPDGPDIISDIVADDDYVYWVSDQQDALVKVSENRLDWESTPPEVVYAHTARPSELQWVGDNIYMLQTGLIPDGLYRVNKNTGTASQLLTAAQVGTNPGSFQTDGDAMTYDVLGSRDDGASWKMVQMGLTSPSAVGDTAVLGGSSQARFKVIANDGFRQGEGMTAAFTMQDKAPVINVLTPSDGDAYVFGQEVYFAAEVLDSQDGSLAGGRITWRDQTDFLLGSGTEFSNDNLLIGENIVTVRATNSDGLSTEVTFSIFVNDELAQPPVTLTVGPDQVGWHIADEETALQSATMSVNNSGEDVFSVAVSEDAPWLSVSQSGSSTPLQLTLTADPVYLASGQTLDTMVQVVGTSAGGTETVLVPVSFSMGYNPTPAPGGGTHTMFLPVVLKP